MTRILPLHEVPPFKNFLNTVRKGNYACCEQAERLRKDGTRIQTKLMRREVRDENEKIVAVLEIARTSGQHAGGLAADAELRPPLEQMPAVLWTTDRTLRITSNWGAGLAEAKIKPGELVGRMLHEYLRCEDPHGTPIAQHAQALHGATSHFEYRHQNRDFGHLAGNRALKRLSDVIQVHCRATDVAARYGGDEFAVVLIDANRGMARQIADRVDHALRNQGERPALSVSIGISVYPEDGRTVQELLETADQHLYRRKRAFRSQIASAP